MFDTEQRWELQGYLPWEAVGDSEVMLDISMNSTQLWQQQFPVFQSGVSMAALLVLRLPPKLQRLDRKSLDIP